MDFGGCSTASALRKSTVWSQNYSFCSVLTSQYSSSELMMDPEFSYIIKNRNTTVQKILNLGPKVSEIAFYEKPSSTFRTFHSLIIEDQWHHYANSGMHTIFCIFLNG